MKKVLLLLCLVLLVGCNSSDEDKNQEKGKEINKKLSEYSLSNELKNYGFEDYDINSFYSDYQIMLNHFAEGSADVDIDCYILNEDEIENESNMNLRYNNYYDKTNFELVMTTNLVPVISYIYKGREYAKENDMKYEVDLNAQESVHSNFYWLRIKPEYVVSSQIASTNNGKVYYINLELQRENIEDFFTQYSNPFVYGLYKDKVELIFETDEELRIKRIIAKYCDDYDGYIYEENQEYIINSYDYQELNIPADIEDWEYVELE